MAKCPYCNNDCEEYYVETMITVCPKCESKSMELTNEEWLHTLNTEEKAEWITDRINVKLSMALHDAELYPDDINENEYMENKDEWVKWLKEKHTDEN